MLAQDRLRDMPRNSIVGPYKRIDLAIQACNALQAG